MTHQVQHYKPLIPKRYCIILYHGIRRGAQNISALKQKAHSQQAWVQASTKEGISRRDVSNAAPSYRHRDSSCCGGITRSFEDRPCLICTVVLHVRKLGGRKPLTPYVQLSRIEDIAEIILRAGILSVCSHKEGIRSEWDVRKKKHRSYCV